MTRSRWRVVAVGMAVAAAAPPVAAGAAGPAFSAPPGLAAQPALYGAACPTATRCVVVGGTDAGTVLTSSDGGRTWTSTTVAGVGALYGVSCLDASHCVAVGTTGGSGADAIATTQDGQTWTAVGSLPAAPSLLSVSCRARRAAWPSGRRRARPAGRAAALFTFDGGASWATAATPTHAGLPTALTAVRCPTAQECFAAGGGAWVSDDFGGTWRDISPPDGCGAGAALCAPTYSDLTALDFTDSMHGAVVGGEQCGGQGVTSCPAVFFSTTDGGASWRMWPQADDKLPFLDAVVCEGLRCLVASNGANGTVLATADGSAWRPAGGVSGAQLNGIACAPAGPCVAAGQVRSAGILLVSRAGPAAIGAASGATVARPAPNAANAGGGSANALVSTLSTSMPTPAAVGSSGLALVLSALLVLALVLLVVFPSVLFNRTYDENHERIRAWWASRLPWVRALTQRASARTLERTGVARRRRRRRRSAGDVPRSSRRVQREECRAVLRHRAVVPLLHRARRAGVGRVPAGAAQRPRTGGSRRCRAACWWAWCASSCRAWSTSSPATCTASSAGSHSRER